jgi:hypothetical protein
LMHQSLDVLHVEAFYVIWTKRVDHHDQNPGRPVVIVPRGGRGTCGYGL